MLENGVFNRPYVRDITKICECACSMNCDKNATELRPDRNPDIITNADRIRSMSDEELAKWLEYEGGGACAEVCGWLKWLQSPAEEET